MTYHKLRWVLAAAIAFLLEAGSLSAYQPFEGAVEAQYVSKALAGQEIAIFGTISRVEPSTTVSKPTLLFITPPQVAPPVVVGYMPDVQRTIHGPYGFPTTGRAVTARGMLHFWNDMLIVRATGPDTIRIEGYDHIHSSTEGKLPSTDAQGYYHSEDIPRFEELMEKEISFAGTVLTFKPSWNDRAPHTITTGDATNKVDIVFWTTGNNAPPAFATKTGGPVFLTGLVQEYRGKLQIRVDDLNFLAGSPLPPEAVRVPAGARRKGGIAAAVTPAPLSYVKSGPLLLDFDQGAKLARAENKRLVVVAWSSEVPVSQTFASTLEESKELRSMHNVVFAGIDGSKNADLLKRYEAYQLPSVLIFSPAGEVLFRSTSIRPEELPQLLSLQ